ncbi:MAG: DUF4157 domain-containing protein, partial [Candidatus Eremiobacteraeota bacterium]|nr:DUF4157 domain-containing protein [Candidatus Eremiobacteraeota bacterium]
MPEFGGKQHACPDRNEIRIRSDPAAASFLERNHAVAATLDAQTILVRPEAEGSRAVLSHEYAHIAQLRSGLHTS